MVSCTVGMRAPSGASRTTSACREFTNTSVVAGAYSDIQSTNMWETTACFAPTPVDATFAHSEGAVRAWRFASAANVRPDSFG